MNEWDKCKRLLIIRADNMGDVLMSSPAIVALKEHFKAHITLLTSQNAVEVAQLIPAIDDVIGFEAPWVKNDSAGVSSSFTELTSILKNGKFDGCIIFTVYSQSALPAAMLALVAEIPLRIAYCRENPYVLLTDWVVDREPFELIRHQVERDLFLVAQIGAHPSCKKIRLQLGVHSFKNVENKLATIGLSQNKGYIILHPGVSETKRRFPKSNWITLAKSLWAKYKLPLLLTGNAAETKFLIELQNELNEAAYVVAGLFTLEEFAALINEATMVISVNTGTVHLAAAMQTPVVVLYAQTNPQHYPWMVTNVVLTYSIAQEQKSKNQLIKYVDEKVYSTHQPLPSNEEILSAAASLMRV